MKCLAHVILFSANLLLTGCGFIVRSDVGKDNGAAHGAPLQLPKANFLVVVQKLFMNDGPEPRAYYGSNPEQPQLLHGPSTNEQRLARGARGIDRSVGHRNRDQMDQGQSQSDRDRGEAARGRLSGGAENDDEKERGQDDLGDQGC